MGEIIQFGEAVLAVEQEAEHNTVLVAITYYTNLIRSEDYEMIKYHLINESKFVIDFIDGLEEIPKELEEFIPKLEAIRTKFGAKEGQSLINAIFNNSANEEYHALADGYEFGCMGKAAGEVMTADEFFADIEKIMESRLRIHKESAGRER